MALAGCAAQPGYVPERGRQKSQVARLVTPKEDPVGTFDTRGRYQPSGIEKGLDCRRLIGVIRIKLEELRSIADDAEPSAVASATRKGMAKAMSGEAPRSEGDERRKRIRARLDGLNALLVEKGCPEVDLAAPSDAPSPLSERKRKKSVP